MHTIWPGLSPIARENRSGENSDEAGGALADPDTVVEIHGLLARLAAGQRGLLGLSARGERSGSRSQGDVPNRRAISRVDRPDDSKRDRACWLSRYRTRSAMYEGSSLYSSTVGANGREGSGQHEQVTRIRRHRGDGG